MRWGQSDDSTYRWQAECIWPWRDSQSMGIKSICVVHFFSSCIRVIREIRGLLFPHECHDRMEVVAANAAAGRIGRFMDRLFSGCTINGDLDTGYNGVFKSAKDFNKRV